MIGNELMTDEFKQFLMDNKERYQGITKEKFAQIYEVGKAQAMMVARAIGLDTKSIEEDNSDMRLSAMLKDGDVVELHGLYWRDDAIEDAHKRFSGCEGDHDE